MLKKAGIIVTAVAAGVLAVGTFAFADTDVADSNQTNDCAFGQTASDVDQSVLGRSSLLGGVDAVTGVVTTLDTQAQAANCTNLNIEDVFDSGSNNSSETTDELEIDDSFNVED